jgi:hypothetical protein
VVDVHEAHVVLLRRRGGRRAPSAP